ncbi:SlyX family protein [Litorivivens sp.]|uniref:SlyX family protein n=1 Tax=Litorivivens sp. TaxID=2020868 RepID=UPI0035662CDC
MTDSPKDSQLADLQMRYAFQEDLLNSLNSTIVEQGRRLDDLEQRYKRLQQAFTALADDVEQSRPVTNERPPHY